ncbi:MAG: SEC-C domain-containing protein [Bacteroidales bacterium]|nr:SEC-C domain-containing protein [Bacteroidales bacterium]
MSKERRLVPFIHTPADAESDTLMVKTIGRNAPCPCGSGKKVKHCCGETKAYFYKKKKTEEPQQA